MCNTELAEHINSKVLNYLRDSDNFPVKIIYEDNILRPQTFHQPEWDINEINWPVYQVNVTHSLAEQEDGHEIDPHEMNKVINEFEIIWKAVSKTSRNKKKGETSNTLVEWGV